MKKSRIEDVLIEEESKRTMDDKQDINKIDSEGVKIIDLTKDIEEEEKYDRHKTNTVKRFISDWYESRKNERKRKKSKRHFKKLRRISAIILSSLAITVIAVIIWNSAQMKKIDEVVNSIDDSYSAQELNIDYVRQLGNLFTIHDKESFDYAINHINMAPEVKSTLFTVNSEGKYEYTGTPEGGIIPTSELIELQYERNDSPLSYLANFKVTLSNGNIRYFLVMCKFRVIDGKTTLTAINIY